MHFVTPMNRYALGWIVRSQGDVTLVNGCLLSVQCPRHLDRGYPDGPAPTSFAWGAVRASAALRWGRQGIIPGHVSLRPSGIGAVC
jgi:hypothetical protein